MERTVYVNIMFKKSMNSTGAGALLVSAFIYATFGLLIRETSEMFGNNAQIVIRFTLAALVVYVYCLVRRKRMALSRLALRRVAGLGVVFAGVIIAFTISVNETKLANSVFLLYAGSIVSSSVVGTLFLKEKLSAAKVIAILVALCGLGMFANTLLALNLGMVMGVVSGLFDGAGNAIRKTLAGTDKRLIIMYSYSVAAIIALVAALITREQWILEVSFWPIVAMIIFVGLMIGISGLLLYGFQHFDVNVGTIILSCELVFATMIGYVFFREVPTMRELIGGALIFTASALTLIDMRAIHRWILQHIKAFV